MTEFEMAYLVNEMRNGVVSSLSLYFGVLTAFLVASYVAAHRLTRTMTTIVVGLFTLFSLLMFASINSQQQALAALAKEVRAFAAAGKGLAWHPGTKVPDWAIDMSIYLGDVLVVAAIVASIYFFFHCRHVNRKTEMGAWKPNA
jgi:cell division protein FtsB